MCLLISLICSSETVYECPDYKTAGNNSCFFNKNDTSLWVNYNITVVATNALGKNISEPVEVDVAYIGMLMSFRQFICTCNLYSIIPSLYFSFSTPSPYDRLQLQILLQRIHQ